MSKQRTPKHSQGFSPFLSPCSKSITLGASAKDTLPSTVCRCCHSHKPSPGTCTRCDQGCLGSHKGPSPVQHKKNIHPSWDDTSMVTHNLASKNPGDPLRTAQSHTLFSFTISSEACKLTECKPYALIW